ncbi:MAG: YifB family Mg chelatase-like AAA ATPase [Patescibacteria group bacterium]|mgnify:CR=1 FL=1
MKSVPRLYSAELDGINAEIVEVEADLNVGLHSFNIVGLADKAVSEAKERVNSALKNCGIKPPTKENRRITINLAPADIKKAGSKFDLPIAIAYLLASDQLKEFETKDKLFVGELSLDGTLRPVSGVLSIAILAKEMGLKYLFVPEENAAEAASISEIKVIPVRRLNELIEHLEGITIIGAQEKTNIEAVYPTHFVRISEIKGQFAAKRALLISAAGGHNLLMSGPPGTGKTMIAQALGSLLPPPTKQETIEITQIYSSIGLNNSKVINHRPFRAPHHSASLVSVIGGGANPRPGEISLAHRGVLFLDETPEFHRDVLEGLRQPLENGSVHVARAKKSLVFPARFQLVAAMNPCPCGYFEDPDKECRCTANEVFRYQKKLSGPLLDRLDIQIEVPRIPIEELRNVGIDTKAENEMRDQIVAARKIQDMRFQETNPRIFSNSEMNSKIVDKLIKLDNAAENFLKHKLEKSFVSARGYYRILKVAQTIADLENSPDIKTEHLAEAFQYRLKND